MSSRRTEYFPRTPGAPAPLVCRVTRRVAFSEVDPMGMAWHGRYASFFEDGASELRRLCGLSYQALYEAGLRVPIVQFHVDYHESILLDEVIAIESRLIWTEAARLNTEFLIRRPGGTIATSGYTVQLFTLGLNAELCLASPPLLEECRQKWQQGRFTHLQ